MPMSDTVHLGGALDPTIMATLSDAPELATIAEDAANRIQAALDTIKDR
jgi:hypothetical protein